MTNKKPLTSITRHRSSQRDNVSFSEPIVLHDSQKTRVTLVPFFIDRTEGNDLNIKIETVAKGRNSWTRVDKKSLSLKEPAVRKLLTGLKKLLAVAEHDDDGDYIVISISNGTASIDNEDPLAVAKAIAGVLNEPDIVQHLANQELSSTLRDALRGAIRIQELRSALASLRQYLNGNIKDEAVYQKWCDDHSWAFGNIYRIPDSIRSISAGDKIDILLPSAVTGYRDIIELKRPNMDVLVYDATHKDYYFSSEASKAIGQCHRYLDVLHTVASKGLLDHPDIVAYHPRATIVMGRSEEWPENKVRALHGLNRRLNGISIMTYDHLLAQGERLMDILGTQDCGDELDTDEQESLDDDWDEV